MLMAAALVVSSQLPVGPNWRAAAYAGLSIYLGQGQLVRKQMNVVGVREVILYLYLVTTREV